MKPEVKAMYWQSERVVVEMTDGEELGVALIGLKTGIRKPARDRVMARKYGERVELAPDEMAPSSLKRVQESVEQYRKLKALKLRGIYEQRNGNS